MPGFAQIQDVVLGLDGPGNSYTRSITIPQQKNRLLSFSSFLSISSFSFFLIFLLFSSFLFSSFVPFSFPFLLSPPSMNISIYTCMHVDTWLAMCPTCICMHVDTWLSMCHPTPVVLKNVKFRLSWNSTKFAWATKFHETNPTVRSVSLSEI